MLPEHATVVLPFTFANEGYHVSHLMSAVRFRNRLQVYAPDVHTIEAAVVRDGFLPMPDDCDVIHGDLSMLDRPRPYDFVTKSEI